MGSTQGETKETSPATNAARAETDSAAAEPMERLAHLLEHQVVAGLAAGLGEVVPPAVDPHAHHVRGEVGVRSAHVARGEEPRADAVDVGGHAQLLELADLRGGEAARDHDTHVAAVALGD